MKMIRICLSVALAAILAGTWAFQEAYANHEEQLDHLYATTKFSLTVLTEPNILYIEGSGMYNEGAIAITGKAPEMFRGYKFVGWKVDGQWYADNPVKVTMDKIHKAVAYYEKISEKISNIRTITIDSSPRVANLLIDGKLYLPSELPLQFEWTKGSTHEIMIFDEEVREGSGSKYVFDKWTDLSEERVRTITVEDNMTMRPLFKIRHYLKVISDYGKTEGSGWYDIGQTVEFSVSPKIVNDETSKNVRYAFAGWSDGDYRNSAMSSITIEKPTTVRAEWKEQYKLELRSSNPEITIQGGGWFDKGQSVALIAAEEYESSSPDMKYVFDEWKNRGQLPAIIKERASTYATITMESSYVIEADFHESYYVSVLSPYGEVIGSGFYKEGTFAEVTLPLKEVEVEAGKMRMVFDRWELVGTEFSSATSPSGDSSELRLMANHVQSNDNAGIDLTQQNINVRIDEPLKIVAKWKPQYYLDVSSSQGTVSGEGWYDVGELARISLKAPSTPPGLWVRYTFDGWSGDFQGVSLEGNVIMTNSKEVKADWKEDYSPAFMNSMIVSGVGAGSAVMYKKTKKKNGNGHADGGIEKIGT
jgi:hypothetical protein